MKGSAKKFFELDPTDSLAENLSGKCIVEFPIIFVVLKDHAYNFEIVTPGIYFVVLFKIQFYLRIKYCAKILNLISIKYLSQSQ